MSNRKVWRIAAVVSLLGVGACSKSDKTSVEPEVRVAPSPAVDGSTRVARPVQRVKKRSPAEGFGLAESSKPVSCRGVVARNAEFEECYSRVPTNYTDYPCFSYDLQEELGPYAVGDENSVVCMPGMLHLNVSGRGITDGFDVRAERAKGTRGQCGTFILRLVKAYSYSHYTPGEVLATISLGKNGRGVFHFAGLKSLTGAKSMTGTNPGAFTCNAGAKAKQ